MSTNYITRSNQTTRSANVLSVGESLAHCRAADAGLTGAARVYLDQSAPSIFSLVRNLTDKSSPTGIVNRLGKQAACHAFEVQIFDNNRSKILYQPEPETMLELGPLIPDSSVTLLEQYNCFAAAIRVKDSKEGLRLIWRQKPEQQQWLEAREGAYLLRTNLTVDGAADLWKKYMQLTEVEAAFRTLKSELAIRPLFHQLEKRVKAHVLVAFLGYALQVTLKHLLKRSASEYSPAEALKRLAEIRSVDIVLPTVEGREIWLRRIAKLDEQQQSILHQLKITLPERLEPLRIQKCSENSAVA